MKKILSVLMTIAMLAALPFAAMAEETEMDTLLEGLVTELVDGGFVMQDVQQGEVMLNTSENTVWDGMLAETELAVGHYVFVEYDGRMTFSLPPQAHADRVASHTLSGSVTEVLEDGSILIDDSTFGETIVHPGEGMNHVYAGMPILVYYDGVMTLSLPGEAVASRIEVPALSGVVSEKTEEGFLLTDEDGVIYEVKFDENTMISEEILPVESEDAQEEADVEDEEAVSGESEAQEEEATTETDAEEPADEAALEDAALVEELALPSAELLSESAIEWADGDSVTVYFDGMMSRSIPAQVTALEVAVIR